MLIKTQKCVCWNVGQSVDAGVLSNVLVKGIQSVLRGESASTKELLLLLELKANRYCTVVFVCTKCMGYIVITDHILHQATLKKNCS